MMGLSKIAGTFFSWLSKSAGIFLKNKNVFMPRMMRLSKITVIFSWLSKIAWIFLKNNVFTLPCGLDFGMGTTSFSININNPYSINTTSFIIGKRTFEQQNQTRTSWSSPSWQSWRWQRPSCLSKAAAAVLWSVGFWQREALFLVVVHFIRRHQAKWYVAHDIWLLFYVIIHIVVSLLLLLLFGGVIIAVGEVLFFLYYCYYYHHIFVVVVVVVLWWTSWPMTIRGSTRTTTC